jgi:hypothetical protein
LGDGLVETGIEICEQQPRSAITHPHLPRRFRQRSVPRDALEQLDLSDADGAPAAEVHSESNCKAFHAQVLGGARVTVNRIAAFGASLN